MPTFDVRGMTCGHCVKAVTASIHELDPAARVDVDLAGVEPLAFASGAPHGRHVTLLLFRVPSMRGEPEPVGVAEVRWASPDEALALPLLPADRGLLERLVMGARDLPPPATEGPEA